jgi:hypothetical protein
MRKLVSRLIRDTLGVKTHCFSESPSDTEHTMGDLVEEMMTLHSSSATFREVFRSQQTTQLYIDGYKSYVDKLKIAPSINSWNKRLVEKLSHLGLAMALDTAVSGNQKREVRLVLPSRIHLLPHDKTDTGHPASW